MLCTHWIRLELAGNVPCANADLSPLPFSLCRSTTFVPGQVDAPINQTKCHFNAFCFTQSLRLTKHWSSENRKQLTV